MWAKVGQALNITTHTDSPLTASRRPTTYVSYMCCLKPVGQYLIIMTSQPYDLGMTQGVFLLLLYIDTYGLAFPKDTFRDASNVHLWNADAYACKHDTL